MPAIPVPAAGADSGASEARELAAQLARTVRALNFVTLPGVVGGLELPADAAVVLADAAAAVHGLRQTLGQVARFLHSERLRPGLVAVSTRDGRRADPARTVTSTLRSLDDARGWLGVAAAYLDTAHHLAADLAVDDVVPAGSTDEERS